MSETRAIDPVVITLKDGRRVECLLSMGGIRRVKARLGVKTIKEILDRDIEECGVPVLYEALLDKQGMDESGFADQLPANLDETGKIVLRLLGASFPDHRPTPEAVQTVQ